MQTLSVSLRALLAQGMASFISFQIIGVLSSTGTTPHLEDATWLIVGMHSSIAVLLSIFLRLPYWWLLIQASFVPAVVLSFNLNITPVLYLLAFVIFWLMFRDNTTERVPLYLSSTQTWECLSQSLPQDNPLRFLDAGCGLGGGIRHLARCHPGSTFYGVESAPIPYIYARIMARNIPNCQVLWGNFRDLDFRNYDLVYAFLSPQPMPALWCKVRKEMRPGTRFISNSFSIPGFAPDSVLDVCDRGQSRLLIWEL